LNYDIIGDIHGHQERLTALLHELGYRERRVGWVFPGATRQAIFVGDFIDRGPGQLATLRTVQAMVKAGSALALMGNHEFNAMAWYTEDPNAPGTYLRPRHGETGDKNFKQHKAFLDEIKDKPEVHQEWVNWFYSLPLWVELPGLRVVHACWHQKHMNALRPRLTPANCLTPELLISASERGSPDYIAVETILKGPDAKLPAGCEFRDKDETPRHEARLRWWNSDAKTWREGAMTGKRDYAWLDDPLPAVASVEYSADKPVFFGHYWMEGAPAVLSRSVACVDYSVAKKGLLAGYRWDGEPELDSSKFVAV
jgi:hypothetical protein